MIAFPNRGLFFFKWEILYYVCSLKGDDCRYEVLGQERVKFSEQVESFTYDRDKAEYMGLGEHRMVNTGNMRKITSVSTMQ